MSNRLKGAAGIAVFFTVVACGPSAPDAKLPDGGALPTKCAEGEVLQTISLHEQSGGTAGPTLADVHACQIEPAGPCIDTTTTGKLTFCAAPNIRQAWSYKLDG